MFKLRYALLRTSRDQTYETNNWKQCKQPNKSAQDQNRGHTTLNEITC